MPESFEVQVTEVIPRTYATKSVRVGFPGAAFKAGQFLQVSLGEGKELTHYLSISNSPTEKGYLEFTKKITPSRFSAGFNALQAADRLRISYPFGKFTYEDHPARRIAFLSGGIGITPIRSICKYLLDAHIPVDAVLVYANRAIEDIVFKDDFDAMSQAHDNLRVAHVLCEPAPHFQCATGFITGAVVKNEVPDYRDRTFFLCGPPGMVGSMKKLLCEGLSLPPAQVVTENFQGY